LLVFRIGEAVSAFGQRDFKSGELQDGARWLIAGTKQPEQAMTRTRLFFILAAIASLGVLALTAARAHDVPKVATGFVANILCSETFVSGLDPDRVFAETTDAMPGAGLISWAMDYKVDRSARDVTVTLFGFGRSHAVYREGFGCYLAFGNASADRALPPSEQQSQPALLPAIAGPSPVAPATPQLGAALDRAFAEPDAPPFRRTRAVVVVKDGRIIAERYADGYGIDTPILGFSATKSVISALIGILVRKGELALDRPAPVAAWQTPGDPRRAITIDQLLRHTAGLALGSSLSASLASALEPVNRMKFMEADKAGYAETIGLETAPGTAWNYHDGNTIILSHLIREAAGGALPTCCALRAPNCSLPSACATSRWSSTNQARRKDRARCWRARATGRGLACSISTTALPGENVSSRRAG
jgi:hypothetical protein